jgi:hypothetical protein
MADHDDVQETVADLDMVLPGYRGSLKSSEFAAEDEDSDADLLTMTSKPPARLEHHEVTNVVFEVNLQFDTNINSLTVHLKSRNPSHSFDPELDGLGQRHFSRPVDGVGLAPHVCFPGVGP